MESIEMTEKERIDAVNKRVKAAGFFGATLGAPLGGYFGYEIGSKRGLSGTDLARFTIRRIMYGGLAFGSVMIAGVLIGFRQ